MNDPNADQKTVDETVAELEQAIGAIEAEFNNGENAKNVNSQGREGVPKVSMEVIIVLQSQIQSKIISQL